MVIFECRCQVDADAETPMPAFLNGCLKVSGKYAKCINLSKSNLHHNCFDNNLQKRLQTNIIENVTGHIFLIVVLMVDLCLNN